MNGTNYFQNEASLPNSGIAPMGAIGRALVLTALSVALTLGVLAVLRTAGAPPPVAGEMVVAPVDM